MIWLGHGEERRYQTASGSSANPGLPAGKAASYIPYLTDYQHARLG